MPTCFSVPHLNGSLPLTRLILRLVWTNSNSVIQWFKSCKHTTHPSVSWFPFFHPSLSFIIFLTPSPTVLANTSDGSATKPTISLSCSPSSLTIQTPHLSPPHIPITFISIFCLFSHFYPFFILPLFSFFLSSSPLCSLSFSAFCPSTLPFCPGISSALSASCLSPSFAPFLLSYNLCTFFPFFHSSLHLSSRIFCYFCPPSLFAPSITLFFHSLASFYQHKPCT